MKKKIFLLLSLFIIGFTAFSESINTTDIKDIIDIFLNKGTYINEERYSLNGKIQTYYPKTYITEVSFRRDDNNILLYITMWCVSSNYIHSFELEYDLSRYSVELDENNNLIINSK